VAKRTALIDKERRHAAMHAKRRKQGVVACIAMGVNHHMDRLPKEIRDQFLAAQLPRPQVIIDASAVGRSGSLKFQKTIIEFLASQYLEVSCEAVNTKPAKNIVCEPTLYFMTMLGIVNNMSHFKLKTHNEAIGATLNDLWKDVVNFIAYGWGTRVWDDLSNMLDSFVMVFSRFDKELYWTKIHSVFEMMEKPGKPLTIEIGCVVPQTVRVSVTGDKSRPVFRVGWTHRDGIIDWTDVDAAKFGGPAGKRYPVYVQQHALTRLHQRLKELGPVVSFALEDTMRSDSLNPIPQGNNNYLVEYRTGSVKCGYLLVKVVGEIVVIITFKFITMLGMPEGDRLAAKLRMDNRMLEWHGLYDLGSFLNTDLFDDPLTASWLEECGIGDLQKMRVFAKNKPRELFAHELKKWCGIDKRKEERMLSFNSLGKTIQRRS
jgi:hypothetical protein